MKTLYESILDDQDVLMTDITNKVKDASKLNPILDELHKKISDVLPGVLVKLDECPPAYKDKGYEAYGLQDFPVNSRDIQKKMDEIMKDTCEKANHKIDGELWVVHAQGRRRQLINYYPEKGSIEGMMIYNYIVRSLDIRKYPLLILKKVF